MEINLIEKIFVDAILNLPINKYFSFEKLLTKQSTSTPY